MKEIIGQHNSAKIFTDIVDNISPTVDIQQVIRPLYNFKASEDQPGYRKKRQPLKIASIK